MDKPYAILDASNKALNFILWDGVSHFDYGQDKGNTLVEIPEGVSYGGGWTYDPATNTFIAPPQPEPTPDS